jgi:DNA-nicking Smr family endonuclease
MRKLRAGDFSVQAQLDLHGLTREAAKPAVEAFVNKARITGHRCVLLVTGRGLNSVDQVPVLKEGVQQWLTRGRAAKQVLGFCSARPKDGGAGAVYVLLRR